MYAGYTIYILTSMLRRITQTYKSITHTRHTVYMIEHTLRYNIHACTTYYTLCGKDLSQVVHTHYRICMRITQQLTI